MLVSILYSLVTWQQCSNLSLPEAAVAVFHDVAAGACHYVNRMEAPLGGHFLTQW